MSGAIKRFVYILQSAAEPAQRYIGRTSDVAQRLKWHNCGPSGHTRRYRPWQILVCIEFPDEAIAARFERYLKSGSGRAFAKRHFAPRDGTESVQIDEKRAGGEVLSAPTTATVVETRVRFGLNTTTKGPGML